MRALKWLGLPLLAVALAYSCPSTANAADVIVTDPPTTYYRDGYYVYDPYTGTYYYRSYSSPYYAPYYYDPYYYRPYRHYYGPSFSFRFGGGHHHHHR